MGNFRVRYGLAYGPEGTAAITSGQAIAPPAFTESDTTPDVSLGTFFVTVNTTATAISYFDWVGPGGSVDPAYANGKQIFILFQDNNTTIANAGQIFCAGTGAAYTSGEVVGFVHYGSAWYQNFGQAVGGGLGREKVKSVTIAGTVAPNVAGASVLLVNNTASSTLIGLSGGVVGQQVTVIKAVAAAGTSLTITGATNFLLAGTTAFVANDSAAYVFFNDGARFRQVGGPIVP